MKLVTIILCLMSAQLVFSQPLKVMTYNLRYDTPSDGVNQWSKRTAKVNALISKYDPDLLGVQEALKHQVEDILKQLPQYDFVGVGRDDGKEKGEYSALLFKKDRFEVVAKKTFWLSETPDQPGSKSWDAAITRIVTVVKFRDKKNSKEFLHLNTHFDHIGLEARKNSARLLHQLMAKEGFSKSKMPVIVTGDFNSEPTEETYRIMISQKEVTLYDSKPVGSTAGTFCGFEVGAMPCKIIDYVFLTKEWKVKNYSVIKDNDGKYYPSDHLPVLVDLMLEQPNRPTVFKADFSNLKPNYFTRSL